MKKLSIILLIFCATVAIVSSEKKVVCYWNSNSIGNVDLKGEFGAAEIDTNICTHIIYTYIRFTRNLNFLAYDAVTIRQFSELKNRNRNVKLLVGIGGARQGSQILSEIAQTATDRDNLSKKIKTVMDDFTLDGCDFDWQWPGQGTGSNVNDKENYVKLLQNMREVFTGSKIFSISVAPRQEDIDKSYDIPRIIDYVDFINLNTYDFHGIVGDNVTAFHSPYRKDPNDRTREGEWNAESVVKNWLSKGCPAEKLTLGIPTYGRSFTLSDINHTGVGAAISGLGTKSEYLREDSNIIPYVEICYNLLISAKWFQYWNTAQFAPYAVHTADQWVGFDDLKVVKAKIHLALDNDLGGLNYATIDRDDFYGHCREGKFPLIKTGYDALIKGEIPANPVITSTTSTTVVPAVTTPEITTSSSTSTPEPTTVSSSTSTKDPDLETRPSTEPSTTKASTTTVSRTTKEKTTTSKTTTSEFPTPPVTIASTLAAGLETTTKNSEPNEEITQEQTTADSDSTQTTSTAGTIPTPPVTPGSRNRRSAEFDY